jgi:hypothetical protein
MSDAQRLAGALNALAKGPQFSYKTARASARADAAVDWSATKALNEDFNTDVDVMRDGSVAEWLPARNAYSARAGARPANPR